MCVLVCVLVLVGWRERAVCVLTDSRHSPDLFKSVLSHLKHLCRLCLSVNLNERDLQGRVSPSEELRLSDLLWTQSTPEPSD